MAEMVMTAEKLNRKNSAKRFYRYKEAAQLFSVGLSTIQRLAKDADAVYKYGKVCLVDVKKVDQYFQGERILIRVGET